MEDLIPGLPEEIARECLLRVPHDAFGTARSVCKLWKQEVESPPFHHLRKSTGLARPLVVVAQTEPAPSPPATKNHATLAPLYRLALFDASTAAWTRLPPIPGLHHGLPLFCQLAAVGTELVVIGGWDPRTWAASDEVFVYDFVSATWRRGARMPGPRRSFFACAASDADRAVFVAGGHDESKNALRSALAYDVARDRWVALPDMARERDECKGVFLRGTFHAIGGYTTEAQGRFSSSAEAFDVAAWKWGPVQERMLESNACPRTCVAGADGKLYMCTGGHVVVMEADAWRRVAELPGDVRVALRMVAWKGNLMLLASGIHGGAQIGYFLKGKGPAAWRKAEMPAAYSGHVQSACCLEI
ncbi:F-box/kelch-repeat protein [Cocos nucifera]|uniref:F-box/kelch-repeat protein n=1 Tax=Cocos nucifera TaxID=13894 RepID=A0A8K0MZZ4_COCNU|nr:F-box/kelch-repeat protein [Cocos nucifera]